MPAVVPVNRDTTAKHPSSVLDIISAHLGPSSSKLQPRDPNVPNSRAGIKPLGKANAVIWKHRRDMKMSVDPTSSKDTKRKIGKNAIQEMYGTGIMAEVEEMEKKRFFDQ